MGNYLSCLVQILLLTSGPLIVFGVLASLARSLFIYLVGRDRMGRTVLTLTLAPSTPLRVLGNAIMATLFGHRITDICFLNVRDPDGELGFVERSYNPRNPIAVLGNFFYALGPVILGLLTVFAVLLGTFGGVLPSFVREIGALAGGGADFFDYADSTGRVLLAMLVGEGNVVLKLVGFALVLFFCMGIFVSVTELVESFTGLLLYTLLGGVFTAVLMLFDVRVQRIVLGGLHSFASLVTALYLVVLLGMAALLVLGALVFLYRFLFGSPEEQPVQAVQEYHNEEYPPERR